MIHFMRWIYQNSAYLQMFWEKGEARLAAHVISAQELASRMISAEICYFTHVSYVSMAF